MASSQGDLDFKPLFEHFKNLHYEDSGTKASLALVEIWLYYYNIGGVDLEFKLNLPTSAPKLSKLVDNLRKDLFGKFREYKLSEKDAQGKRKQSTKLLDQFLNRSMTKVMVSCGYVEAKDAEQEPHATFLIGVGSNLEITTRTPPPLLPPRYSQGRRIRCGAFPTLRWSFAMWEKARNRVFLWRGGRRMGWWGLELVLHGILECIPGGATERNREPVSRDRRMSQRLGKFFSKQFYWNRRLRQLLNSNHHTRNQLLGIMQELSVTNLSDSVLEQRIYLKLRNAMHIDQLEGQINHLMDRMIDEQRLHEDYKRQSYMRFLEVAALAGALASTGGFLFQLADHQRSVALISTTAELIQEGMVVDPAGVDSLQAGKETVPTEDTLPCAPKDTTRLP